MRKSSPSSSEDFELSSNTQRVGVLFVHGVGQAAHSDTLIDFGNAFSGWVARWQRAHHEPIMYGEAELSFTPYDAGSDNTVPFAELHVRDDKTWVLAEAWWSGSARPMPFTSMLTWSWRNLWGLVWNLFETMARRFDRLFNKSEYDAGFFARLIDLINSLGLAAVYLIIGIVGYLLLLPVTILAQIPYRPFQQFVLITLLQPFLQYNASELRVYIEDEIQAANMRRRVADAVDWLTDAKRGNCSSVVILAHSGGAWVAHGMLTDETYAEQRLRVRKLITMGAGLNKVWAIAPRSLERVRRSLKANIYWVDFWSSYDPVPAGWLDPPRDEQTNSYWPPIYEPGDTYAEEHGLKRRARPRPPDQRPGWKASAPNALPDEPLTGGTRNYWPDSIRVVNRMDVLTDHGGYFTNDEEVLRRVAAEIESDIYTCSYFWKGQRADAIPRRRARVTWLGFVRQVALVVGAMLALQWAAPLAGWIAGVGALASMTAGFRGLVQFIASRIPTVGPLLITGADWIVTALLTLAGGTLAIGVAIAVFEVYRGFWERNDLNQREVLLSQDVPGASDRWTC